MSACGATTSAGWLRIILKIPRAVLAGCSLPRRPGLKPVGDDPLSGVFAAVLTASWSNLLGSLLPANLVTGLLVVAVGAAINAAIIYVVSRWLVGWVIK